MNWAAVLARVLPHVDLLLPGADELAVMLRPETPVPVPDAAVPDLAAALGLGPTWSP